MARISSRQSIIAGIWCLIAATGADAETIRLATWNAGLSRNGPAVLLRDLQKGKDPQIAAVVHILTTVRPDVLLLTGFDWDYESQSVNTLRALLQGAGVDYPHFFARQPNTGIPTGLDIDGNGRTDEPRDAQGYGLFTGDDGMVLLSRLPIDHENARDYSQMLWKDFVGNRIGDALPVGRDVLRLSTTAHWVVPVRIGPSQTLSIMAYAATPPVFDGPEDRNGRRNHDETAFWLSIMDGVEPPFAILGNAALDPVDGDGTPDALLRLLSDPRIQDTHPSSAGAQAAADAYHRGNPATDTAAYAPPVGNLRVDYVLPSADLTVAGSGVFWPPAGAPLADAAETASRHKLVWVDISVP